MEMSRNAKGENDGEIQTFNIIRANRNLHNAEGRKKSAQDWESIES